MIRNRTASLALVGLFVWVTGCHSYRQIELAEVADHGKVRVTFSDGERIVSKDVTVEGDSIRYWQKADESTKYSAVRISTPLDQVVEVEAAGAGSGGIIVVAIGGALVAFGLISAATWYD